MLFSLRRDSEIRPSQKSFQTVPCFFKSIWTATLRPLPSITNLIPIITSLPGEALHPVKVVSFLGRLCSLIHLTLLAYDVDEISHGEMDIDQMQAPIGLDLSAD